MNSRKEMTLSNCEQRENTLLKNVYLWMSLGLVITGAVAYAVSRNMALLKFFNTNLFALLALVIAQVALVIALSSRLERLNAATAVVLFLAYSGVTGVTLSSIFILYTGAVITQAFLTAAAMFLGASLFAFVFKGNVASWSRYLLIGLWGMMAALLINMFFPGSTTLTLIISIVGVVLFTGLTVYDTARVKSINDSYGSEMNQDEFTKLGIIGALTLYLDFLNIFLYILRIFGAIRRD
jgi:Integral membrane protein, interacts with FtsH